MSHDHRGFGTLWAGALSPGAWVIALLAAVSGIAAIALPVRERQGLEVWMFSPEHRLMYTSAAAEWEARHGEAVNLRVFGLGALSRRMMGGFFAGVETADLIEIERQISDPVFAGPLEAVGFLDITDRVEAQGLVGRINPPSFTPWTSRGRIFGLPHDVHPVLLGYRADIVEAAGIDVNQIHTWEDFRRVLGPLMADRDGDGQPDRYLLGFWENQIDNLDVLMLQGGGALFDAQGACVLDSERNAELLAEVVSWCVGEGRFCTEINEWTSTGHNQKIEGRAVAYLMPDWMCGIWLTQIPQLAGKVKLMPLPAFEPGGRRTSVRGGSMMGIPKTAEDPERSWAFLTELYLSRDLARELYRTTGIVTPVTEHWSDPVFDEPSAYFSGQPIGRLYIEAAPDVPPRPASAFYRSAQLRLLDAAVRVAEQARARGLSGAEALRPLAAQALTEAQASVERQMARNAFAGAVQP